MPTLEQLIDQYGGLDKVPDYIRAHYENRERLDAERDAAVQEAERERVAEEARVRALRRPPRHAHLARQGALTKIRWSPPETADELALLGYWVSEERNGEWTRHGDFVLPHVREASLFGSGPAYVETVYNQQALGEIYRSPVVSYDSPETGPAAGGATEETPPPAAGVSRLERIVAAVRTFIGRRTRDGRPWVRPLRKHAGMPDITTDERDRAHEGAR